MSDFNCCKPMDTKIENSKIEDPNFDKAMTALGVFALIDELSKKANIIKELQTENSKLKEENCTLKEEKAALKKENELLNNCYKISEEMRDKCKEKTVIKLKKEIKYLEQKIQDLEYDLTKQVQLNVYLVRALKEKEE